MFKIVEITKGNEIGDKGATAIGNMLMSNSTLTTIYVEGNQIGDKGATAIAEGLKKNSTLQDLVINSKEFLF